MSQQPLPLRAEQLVAHLQFVQRLARHLLKDDAAAEDTAQDVWLAARNCAPHCSEKTVSWLAAITRNLTRTAKRAERRRENREHAIARQEALPSTDVIVERMEVHRTLVDCVLALPDPYRATILERFFNDRSLRDLAASEGIPLETLRTRLKRGLALLRRRLQARHLALWPHLALQLSPGTAMPSTILSATSLPATSVGALAMGIAAKLGITAGVVLGLSIGALQLIRDDAPVRTDPVTASIPASNRTIGNDPPIATPIPREPLPAFRSIAGPSRANEPLRTTATASILAPSAVTVTPPQDVSDVIDVGEQGQWSPRLKRRGWD